MQLEIGIRVEGLVYVIGLCLVFGLILLYLLGLCVGIVGCNGLGKSMLVWLLVGLIQFGEGQICIEGVDIWQDCCVVIVMVGILFQNLEYQIIFFMVFEEMVFGLCQQGCSKVEVCQIVLDMLVIFGKLYWQDVNIDVLL